MQTVTTVRDVGDPQILAGRQQILHTLRQQRPQRDLKRKTADIHIGAQSSAGMQVDPIAAHPDAVHKPLGTIQPSLPSLLDADMLF